MSKKLGVIWRRNGLSLVLFGLFLLSWIGQALTGWADINTERREKQQSSIAFVDYLASGDFWELTGENWESEFLQMAVFVLLTCCLVQKGSPESKDPDAPAEDPPELHRHDPGAPWPVRRGGWWLRWYRNSLSMAFILLFVGSMALHALGGSRVMARERWEQGRSTPSAGEYLTSARFWVESLQNWQSEFLSLAAMVFFSVYLRQYGSAESKRVYASHGDHE